MKSLIASIAILGLVGMVVGITASAATDGTVTATVTPQNISVSLSATSTNYGILALSTSDGSRTTATSSVFTVTNNGNVTENFDIRGASSTDWTLNSSPATTGAVGSNQFVHRFDADSVFTTGTAKALSTSNQTLGASIATSGTQDFVLQMNMPTASSVTAQQSTTVTVVATAF